MKCKKNSSDFLQVPILPNLEKDSAYLIHFDVDPRFSLPNYAKNRTIQITVLNQDMSLAETENYININRSISKWTIPFENLIKSDEENVYCEIKFKATGKEKVIIIWLSSSKKEEVMITLKNVCMRKKGTDCFEPLKIPIIERVSSPTVSKSFIDLYFDSDIDTLNLRQKELLFSTLKNKPKLDSIICLGFADSMENYNYNIDLSKRRAENVRQQILAKYPLKIVQAKGKGIAANPENKQNRLVRVYFTSQED